MLCPAPLVYLFIFPFTVYAILIDFIIHLINPLPWSHMTMYVLGRVFVLYVGEHKKGKFTFLGIFFCTVTTLLLLIKKTFNKKGLS